MAVHKSLHFNHAPRRSSPREHDLENLRSFLTGLVIFHHTAIVYGGVGGWGFKPLCFPAASLALTAFNAINQTFFMGTFFFLSGHFTRQSMSRSSKSKADLIRSRLLRLGVPTLLHTLLVDPTLKALVMLFDPMREMKADRTTVGDVYGTYWSQLRGVRGPVWYLAMAMVFDFLTVIVFPAQFGDLLKWLCASQSKSLLIPTLWVANILTSFMLRLVYPVERIFTLLNLRPAFLAHYIMAYVWGHASVLACENLIFAPFRGTIRPLTDLVWSLCLTVLGLFVVFGVSLFLSGSVSASVESLMGGFTLPALLYTVWNEVSFALMAPALMRVFARYMNHPVHVSIPGYRSDFSRKVLLARYSYAAFLSHAFVSLGVELAVEILCACSSIPSPSTMYTYFGPILMSTSVGVINVLLSYFVGYMLVEYVPRAGNII
ncbi:hypothetical protein GJ744_001520 [Endocarpon pusillum]|uniref:Acyltransferase 3 domain-containing protein n=1 Tax=Endocarpon pusillum TaxID=364733 RepID=A0A8H7DZG8_9EURO|nr:hypothetical protein GJ744_001520 [Endocarpon pusillum]